MGMLKVERQIQSNEQYEQAVAQTVCFMSSALAFSRWGMLQNFDPLAALLITPTCIYSMTLTKPRDTAMGLDLAIERIMDLAMMEWVLSEHIKHYVSEQVRVLPAYIISP